MSSVSHCGCSPLLSDVCGNPLVQSFPADRIHNKQVVPILRDVWRAPERTRERYDAGEILGARGWSFCSVESSRGFAIDGPGCGGSLTPLFFSIVIE